MGYWCESWKEGDDWEDKNICQLVISKQMLREIGWGSMDLINLTQVRGKWKAIVNMVISLCIP